MYIVESLEMSTGEGPPYKCEKIEKVKSAGELPGHGWHESLKLKY